MQMEASKDKASAEFQRLSWDALRKSINGLINKVSTRFPIHHLVAMSRRMGGVRGGKGREGEGKERELNLLLVLVSASFFVAFL